MGRGRVQAGLPEPSAPCGLGNSVGCILLIVGCRLGCILTEQRQQLSERTGAGPCQHSPAPPGPSPLARAALRADRKDTWAGRVQAAEYHTCKVKGERLGMVICMHTAGLCRPLEGMESPCSKAQSLQLSARRKQPGSQAHLQHVVRGRPREQHLPHHQRLGHCVGGGVVPDPAQRLRSSTAHAACGG